jgi:heat shock protein HslJ
MKVWRLAAPALAVALALGTAAGCGSDSDSDGAGDGGGSSASPVTTDDLEGMTWTSTSVTGHDLVSGTEVKVTFADGSMSLNAGCNTMAATYAVDGGTLAWTGEPHSTMMACSDPLTAQDDWLRQAFSDGWDATTDGSTLTLTQGDVTMEMGMKSME